MEIISTMLLLLTINAPFNDAASPYRMVSSAEATHIETCKGPKRKECALMKTYRNGNLLCYEMDVIEDVGLSHGKMVATTNNKETIKYQMKKPCDHLLLKSLLQHYLNVTDDCKIKKGHYEFSVDVAAVSNKYYKENYMFGNWTFKTIMYAHDCNVVCTVVGINFF